jgi:serine/threonine protein kinase
MENRSGEFQGLEGAGLPSNLDVIRILGKGSMACVYLVRDNVLKRLVALKVLRRNLAADPIGRKRFVREAQAAARISHPCVTSVYTVGALSNDVPYIEMEYVEGNNLAEMLKSHGQLDILAARKLLAQLSSALAVAHASRIIHRDVKPANVLIQNESRRAFLTDFGVAGILESGSEAVTRLTKEGERFGDPAYMSPEQLRGEALTPQTDIYSFGILGYEMLTLHGPFGDFEVTDLTGAHLRRPPLDLHVMHPEIPIYFSDALKRCLSKKPEHRPRAKDLEELFESAAPASTKSDMTLGAYSAPQSALVSFLHELKKRRVYRAAVTYAAITFVVLQVADLVLPPFGAPTWVFRLLVVASVAGFPVAVVLAWLFDLRQGRLLRTDAIAGSFSRKTSRTQRLVLQALGLILSIALAALAAWWLLGSVD